MSTSKAVGILYHLKGWVLPVILNAQLSEFTAATDDFRDVELVDVEWGRDDPHADESDAIDDIASNSELGSNFTAFNHFIDIKKGPGIFDDYDGYSYARGSASGDEHQDASEVTDGFAKFMSWLTGYKVDEGINWWFNDNYVHAPCHPWYKDCSPALDRYSYYRDKGIYPDKIAELAARFPLAECLGDEGRGVPYSVFMPVDNLARYWYSRYLYSGTVKYLAPVLHAIQDACILHHAAGYNGNWHSDYEAAVEERLLMDERDPAFNAEILHLVDEWNWLDPDPPRALFPADKDRKPAKNWGIDMLVTWMALNAYHEYANTYNHYRDGNMVHVNSIFRLNTLAIAMSALALLKACEEHPVFLVGNSSTREVHTNTCRYARKIRDEHRAEFATITDAFSRGYNGCRFCLRFYDDSTYLDSVRKPYIGNKISKEFHSKKCRIVRLLATENIVPFDSIAEALDAGYNGCYHCLRNVDPVTSIASVDAPYVGNRSAMELHQKQCRAAAFLSTANIEPFDTIDEALAKGYNGCYFCLREYNNLGRTGEARTDFVGNKNTRQLHSKTCSYARLISAENIVEFSSVKDAFREGYTGCHFCLGKYDGKDPYLSDFA